MTRPSTPTSGGQPKTMSSRLLTMKVRSFRPFQETRSRLLVHATRCRLIHPVAFNHSQYTQSGHWRPSFHQAPEADRLGAFHAWHANLCSAPFYRFKRSICCSRDRGEGQIPGTVAECCTRGRNGMDPEPPRSEWIHEWKSANHEW
jgi:hypothetical protein